MVIKRKFEMLIATRRRYTILRSSPDETTACPECGEPMLAIGQAAAFFGVKQRAIFKIIETGSPHFSESKVGEVMICLPSLAAVLECEGQNDQSLFQD
jgi:hypothetical protein